jgi:hypothetical protein
LSAAVKACARSAAIKAALSATVKASSLTAAIKAALSALVVALAILVSGSGLGSSKAAASPSLSVIERTAVVSAAAPLSAL